MQRYEGCGGGGVGLLWSLSEALGGSGRQKRGRVKLHPAGVSPRRRGGVTI